MPKRVDAEEQRRRVVRSAFRVLARDGLEGLSMRRVAREAGCTIGLINHWFTSREDLVMAAWLEAVRHESQHADQLRAEGAFSAENVLLNTLPTTPDLRRKELVWQAFAALAVSNAAVRKVYNRHYAFARRLLSEALAADCLPAGQDEEIADLLIAATDGVAKMAALDPVRWTPTRQRVALRKLIEPHLSAARVAPAVQKRKVKSAP
ncbi:MAG: HTH-type transcriptional regulator BetI [Steroidobacteraceae bacterium]|nr:HTH-type transcriptional regulator BetI [Steroidobacteraceae bacterium]